MKRFTSICLALVMALGLALVGMPAAEAKPKKSTGWVYKYRYGSWEGDYVGKAKKVTMPKGVEYLNSLSSSVRELHLAFGAEARGLYNAKNLEKITVSKKNNDYFAKDGVLYEYNSTSKKKDYTLRYYPIKKKTSSYTVLKGTTYIDMVSNNYVKTLKLPDSLEDITEIRGKKIQKLRIPKNVTTIERIDIPGKITLAKNHKYFTVSEGVIFSRKGRRLEYYPSTKKDKSYTLPTKVTSLNPSAFESNRYLKTLYLPESDTVWEGSS